MAAGLGLIKYVCLEYLVELNGVRSLAIDSHQSFLFMVPVSILPQE